MAVTLIPKRLMSIELLNLAAQRPNELVALCEQAYAKRVECAAQSVLASGARIVMLTGPSASGKTTSANRIAEAVRRRGKTAEVISLDDFFLGRGKYPLRADGTEDYECLESLDVPQLKACLADLVEKGECMVPRFDFITQQPSGEYFPASCKDGVVIIEGLHAFNPTLIEQLPREQVFLIYAGLREEFSGEDGRRAVSTKDIRLARRLTRDCLYRGHGADFTLELWPHVCESENKYIRCYKRNADLIFDTSFSYEVCMWAKLIQSAKETLEENSRHAKTLYALCDRMAAFRPIEKELVPEDSMLREFVGKRGE